jgi:hypothetical protein
MAVMGICWMLSIGVNACKRDALMGRNLTPQPFVHKTDHWAQQVFWHKQKSNMLEAMMASLGRQSYQLMYRTVTVTSLEMLSVRNMSY